MSTNQTLTEANIGAVIHARDGYYLVLEGRLDLSIGFNSPDGLEVEYNFDYIVEIMGNEITDEIHSEWEEN